MADEMEEIIQDFLVETKELLDGLDQKFVELEKDRKNQPLLNEIFRSVHTIKGASGFLGFNQLVEVTHGTESILKKLKDGLMEAAPEIMDTILSAVDKMKILVGHIRDKDSVQEDISDLVKSLEEIINKQQLAQSVETVQEIVETQASALPSEPSIEDGAFILAGNPESEGNGHDPMVQTESIQAVLTLEQVIADNGLEDHEESKIVKPEREEVYLASANVLPSSEQTSQLQQAEKTSPTEQTIRVDVQRLDSVLNLVGELVLGRNRLMTISSNLEVTRADDSEVSALAEASAFINLITTDLQIAVMKTRMQPVKKVFNRFPRMVRDLARSKGKMVELKVFGEETELDKSVIEEIGDPLVHLIRNALDHGIESPEEREKMGKPREGRVRLSAAQEGNNIILEIEDDGKGIDPEVLRLKAVEKGFASQADAEKLSDQDAIDLIFMPGFSTAKVISDISGRGVGMDVVRTNISKLNGYIDIKTQVDKGTRFIIRLPLTLAIIQALMVEVGHDTFAIPLSIVVETVRISREELKTIDSKEVMVLRGQVLSLIRLGKEFGITSTNGLDKVYVVVVALGERKFGIVVDRLQGQEEVVIKAIEGKYGTTEGIAGATITGNGRVVLILDMARIVDRLLKKVGVHS